ncbi:kelch repeat protein [Cooperia oncophora]
MSTPRQYLGSAVLHDHLYAAGGKDGSSRHRSVEKYSPVAEKWTAVADMKESRKSVRLAVANGRLYAIGGNGTTDQETVEIFDIETNQWELHSYLNEA